MSASVNIFIPDQNLIDNSIAGFKTELGKLNSNHSASFFHIIYKQSRNGGKSVRMDSSDFSQHLHCCRNTVTNINNRLEALGILNVEHIDTYPHGKKHTVNYYSINWERAILCLGEKIFGASLGEKYNFILSKVVSFFNAHRAQILGTLILSSKEDISNYIYKNLFVFFEKVARIKEALFSKGEDSMDDRETPIEGVVMDPVSYMLVSGDSGKKKVFDPSIIDCPHIYREYALSYYSYEDRVDENFENFRNYHIEKRSKFSNWLRAWINWLRGSKTYFINISERDRGVRDQFQRKQELKMNAEQFSLPTSKISPMRAIKNILTSITDPSTRKFHWREDTPCPAHYADTLKLHNLSHDFLPEIYARYTKFWAVEATTKIERTQKDWDIIWEKNIEREVAFRFKRLKPNSTYVFKPEEKEIEIVLPEENGDIHQTLLARLGKANYTSWIQGAVIKKLDEPTEYDSYTIFHSCSFRRSKLITPDMGDIIRGLRIKII